MMKRFKFLILPITAAAVMLSACGEEPVNQGPELRGISDITCFVNTSVDLLDGVAALDTEDGDITPELKITVIPEVKVENGYAVFSQVGDYEICYEVYDSLASLQELRRSLRLLNATYTLRMFAQVVFQFRLAEVPNLFQKD